MKKGIVGPVKRPSKTTRQLRRAFGVLGLFALAFALPTVSISQFKTCSNYPETPVGSDISAAPGRLSVLLYNTQLRPRLLFASGQSDRTQKLIPLLAGYDVVVLSEVFDDQSLRELSTLHSYQSASLPLGKNEGLSQDSGLVVFSQWPMLATAQKQRLFESDCEGNSCFNYQGVLSVALKKKESTYHVVSAQMQAGESQKAIAIRASQYRQIRLFIDSLNIPPDEPVIFAASLPISPQAHPEEFAQMQAEIGLKLVDTRAEDSILPGVSSTRDGLTDNPSSMTVDALFTLNQSAIIKSANAKVWPMRTAPEQGWKSAPWFYWQCPQQDLSNHHAIEGKFRLR